MAEEKKAQQTPARPAAKPDRTAAKPKESYSLYSESGRKLKSGVPRAEAVAEKDRRKHQESKNSTLQPD
jgi:hypothetical protein